MGNGSILTHNGHGSISPHNDPRSIQAYNGNGSTLAHCSHRLIPSQNDPRSIEAQIAVGQFCLKMIPGQFRLTGLTIWPWVNSVNCDSRWAWVNWGSQYGHGSILAYNGHWSILSSVAHNMVMGQFWLTIWPWVIASANERKETLSFLLTLESFTFYQQRIHFSEQYKWMAILYSTQFLVHTWRTLVNFFWLRFS